MTIRALTQSVKTIPPSDEPDPKCGDGPTRRSEFNQQQSLITKMNSDHLKSKTPRGTMEEVVISPERKTLERPMDTNSLKLERE